MELKEKQKIQLELLEELLQDVKPMHSEYIVEHIEGQIDIIKNGI